MANASKSPDESRAVMARKTNKEGATGTPKAERSRLADGGYFGLSGTDAEQKLPNLAARLDMTLSQPVERKAKK